MLTLSADLSSRLNVSGADDLYVGQFQQLILPVDPQPIKSCVQAASKIELVRGKIAELEKMEADLKSNIIIITAKLSQSAADMETLTSLRHSLASIEDRLGFQTSVLASETSILASQMAIYSCPNHYSRGEGATIKWS